MLKRSGASRDGKAGRALIAVFAAALLFADSAYAQEQSAPEAAAVRTVLESFAAHVQNRQLSAVDTLFARSRGTHIIEDSGVSHGWPEYRDKHLAPRMPEGARVIYSFPVIESQVRQNVAWTAVRYEMIVQGTTGPLVQAGRGTFVLEKQGSQWLIVHMHLSGARGP